MSQLMRRLTKPLCSEEWSILVIAWLLVVFVLTIFGL
jgi:hypothetical protein